MSEIDNFFLQTNLIELNSPHKLSRYILRAPHYKELIQKDNTSSNELESKHNRNDSCSLKDLIITNKLSEFIYQQRLNGKFFLFNFMKEDFQNMMDIIYQDIEPDEDIHNYDWIWSIIQNDIKTTQQKTPIQSKTTQQKHPVESNTLNWVNSPWNRYEILHNHNKFTSTEEKQPIACVSVNKCKALKRLIMVLHFYQSLLIDQTDDDNDLFLLPQYIKNHENIYTDYQHIFTTHLLIGSSQTDVNTNNLQIIKDKIKIYIKCDMNKCKSYHRKDSDDINKCIKQMQRGNINADNMLELCSEIMDIIHCYFVHNVSFSPIVSNSVVKVNKQKSNSKISFDKRVLKDSRKDKKSQSFTCLNFACL